MDLQTAFSFWVVGYPSALSLYVMITASIPAIFAGRGWRECRDSELSVAILVPAKDEESVIGDCITSLLQTSHSRVNVHVISDGSSDGTVAIARSFLDPRLQVHEFDRNRGKSAALEAILPLVGDDLVMVVDADTRLDSEAVSRLAGVFEDRAVAGATGNIRVKQARNLLGKLQAVEFASIIGLLKRANSVWGGSSP